MIKTIGFESEGSISVTDNINKIMDDMTKQHGSTFRLIDIKLAAAAKAFESNGDYADVNYSALIVY